MGHKSSMNKKKIKSLTNFAKLKSPDTELEFIEVPRDSLTDCIDALNKIADENPEAYYELTGGGEMILIAFGYVSATRNLKTIRIDPYTGLELSILPGSEPTQHQDAISITVKENIILHGGKLTQQTGNYSTWSFTESFYQDIRTIWEIAKNLRHKWNRYCAVIEDVIKANPCDESGLCTSAS